MSSPSPETSNVATGPSPFVPLRYPGLARPAYEGRSLSNIAATVFDAVGGGSRAPPPMGPPLASDLDPFRGGRAEGPVIVFLVDALGERQLAHWAGRGSPRADRWRRKARPLSTVFPSTTTVALTSLSTGAPPGRHGVVGYREYLPAFGMVADLLKMSPVGVAARDLLVGPEWRPEIVCGAPTVFRRGIDATIVTRASFEGSGFTRLIYDGAPIVPYSTGAELAHQLRRVLERTPPPPVVFVYWDELDTIQHLYGPDPDLVDLELERVAGLLEYAAARVPRAIGDSTTVLISGDHGQVPATVAARIALDAEPAIRAELARPLAGDRRAGFLAARPGRLPALQEALAARLPTGSHVIPMPEALDLGLFGPPPFHPEVEERLGDLLVLVPSPAGLTYLPPGASAGRHLEGAHGGLEPDELAVPLVTGRLREFAPSTDVGKR